ncbi:hypothetical protein [Croceibacterium ferulae]|uniref:hypothetical protein n=1 Tax=Croceibacterium ferulae TaxID=1854641 RepID=UPI000EAEB22C|nr:hypothetical protein [Croceibacterium ferulae]
MRIDPAIAALRADRSLQQQAQMAMGATCTAWRADRAVAAAIGDLDRYGNGAPLEACPALEAMFTDQVTAPELTSALMRHFLPVLRDRHFAHPPFRHSHAGALSTLLLARSGRACLTIHAREPGQWSYDFAGYSDALRHEAVLAGEGEGRIVRCARHPDGTPQLDNETIQLTPGGRLALDLNSETLQVMSARVRLVTLRLQREAASPAPAREHSLQDGRVLRQASGSIRSSRQEMMLALLGRMKRAEAAPVMAEMACEEGDPSLRWQAMRESLALDTAAGFTALVALARRPHDPLARAAGALRAQLVEAHPELLALEATCPA